MKTSPLGWQSWSPPSPFWPKFPLWDYCPLSSSKYSSFSTLTKPLKSPISLWCSWHSYGTNIDEKLILGQASKFLKNRYIPEYILIDDGWCHWGDWMSPTSSKFQSTLNPLVSKLSNLKYKTGLWIAPFLVSPDSELVKIHPDWIIKNKNGSYFNGFSSYPIIKELTPKYLLDINNKAAMSYIKKCLDIIINDWGVTLLKLDHLYAPYFATNPSVANQASYMLTDLLEYIQSKYPNIYTIACGCPFNIAQNKVDAIRISKDINSPQLKTVPLLNYLLYIKRKKLLNRKLNIVKSISPLPFGIDPDAAIFQRDVDEYYQLWQSGIIQVFGLGYSL